MATSAHHPKGRGSGLRKLQIRLYGSFEAKWSDGESLAIRGAKHRALLAMLVTAAHGTHSRGWLQDNLWGRAGPDHGRASLRRALSDLRRTFGEEFEKLFASNNVDISIDMNLVEIIGDPRDGQFLEGISIAEQGFQSWLLEKRNKQSTSNLRLVPGPGERIAPTLAVIPFMTKSRAADDRHFSDLFAQEVTRALSRSRFINVISHLSSRQFEQNVVDLNTVRTTLGIDYIVYGTVQISGDVFRIDADFADAGNGTVHWTRDFTGKVSDLLSGRDPVVADLSRQIGHSVLSASVELAQSRPLPDVDSHALLMSSITLMHQHVRDGFDRAKRQLDELIKRSPNHAILHAWLGMWHVLSVNQGWSLDVGGAAHQASTCTERALNLNSHCSFSLAVDGMVNNNLMKNFDVSSRRFEEALQIDPNNSLAWLLRGTLHAFMDNGAIAVEYTRRARELSPLDPHRYFYDSLSATAHLAANDYPGALTLADASLAANRRHTSTLRVRTIALQRMGRTEEARATAEELLRLEPELTTTAYLANHPAARFETGRNWADALAEAGVPRG